jgi:macrodomain Ter protein organizer (MatP/YcbG family)
VNIFNEFYDIQESWIRRQITDLKYDSFVDLHIARNQIEDEGITAFNNFTSIDQFREQHLSKSGKNKLSSTLRTYKKRNKRKLTTKRLDIDISLSAHLALAALISESGLTKTQIIEQLILNERNKQIEFCDTVT